MRYFFRSRRFKIAASVISVLIVLSLIAYIFGGAVSPQSSVFGAIVTPIQSAFTSLSNSVKDINTKINGNKKLMEENRKLKQKVDELTSSLIDYSEAEQQNEFLKQYLEIKENHTDFRFEEAMLVAFDSDDPFCSFTLNKGSLQGVELYDPVITSSGLIGYISQVELSYSKVTTVLSPDVAVASFDRRTADTGVVSGSADNAKSGTTRLSNLSRSCSVAIGDYIVTSGGGVFPSGMLIGSVTSVGTDYNNSIYAEITPAVQFSDLREMMIITYFSGQSNMSGE